METKHFIRANKWKFFILLLTMIFAPVTQSQTIEHTLRSPNGRLEISFMTVAGNKLTPDSGNLVYTISVSGKALIEMSALNLELKGQTPLGSNVKITGIVPAKKDTSFTLIVGKTNNVRNNYNALEIFLDETKSPWRKLVIEARAFNDAIAFRYSVPKQEGLEKFELVNENTEFRIAKDANTFSLVLPNYKTSYEGEFINLPITALAYQSSGENKLLIGLPILMEVPGVAWMAITEAGLKDYSSMYLGTFSQHGFISQLAPPQDDNRGIVVEGNLPHQSAWRVIMIAEEPGKLIESNVIACLSPAPAFNDLSWIHPGKASWDWWSGSLGPDGKPAFTTETMKYYVDFAYQSGFEYMLVDAGWSARGDITKMNGRVDIPELVKYAAQKNVKIWVWLNYSTAKVQMNEAFPIYEKWGVAGLKIDFVMRDDQEGLKWYYAVAELAARHHLMLDFHGCTKPFGLEYTYPNVLSYEAVMGMEFSKFGTRDNPIHHVTFPFTRMLTGPIDYTPGGFDNATKEEFEFRSQNPMVMGTRSHHLAMFVVYYCPFQMVSDHPSAYEGDPTFEFIKKVPVSWDETHFIEGKPGEYIVLARRKGNEWYLGCMTNWETRELDVPLDFLGNGKYVAEIYTDAAESDKNPKNVDIKKIETDKTKRIKIKLTTGGGCAIRFTLGK